MQEKKVYKRLTIESVEFVRLLIERSLEKMNSRTVRKRSVYHGASSTAAKISRDHDSNRKVITKKGKEWLGAQSIIRPILKVHRYKKTTKHPEPGEERKLMTIGNSRANNYVDLYEGDMVSVIEDTNNDILIVIRQNNENKKKETRSFYNTVIRK